MNDTSTFLPGEQNISRWRWALRALEHRNYRLFFTGQGLSLIGSWMQRIAMSWLVYRLTDSAFLLGVVGFMSEIPIIIIAPFAGVLVDRFSRQRIVLWAQVLSMIQAFVLAFLVFTERIEIWHIFVLGVALGIVHAMDMPARQSFVVEMVEKKDDLPSAIALNSTLFNSARLIGPSVAGILIAGFGEALCFFINGLSFLPMIFGLRMMRIPPRIGASRKTKILSDMSEGFAYALGFMPIRSILLLLAVMSMMGMSYSVLMPIFAQDILGGDSGTFGLLMAAAGVGALGGAGFLAFRKNIRGLVRMIALTSGIFGVGLVAFSFSRELWLSLVFLAVAGFGMMVQTASSNTVLQTIVEDDKRGRVMGLFTMSVRGMLPFGSLFAGTLASRIGAPHALLITGACCVAASLWFNRNLPALRVAIRPVYERIGVIQKDG